MTVPLAISFTATRDLDAAGEEVILNVRWGSSWRNGRTRAKHPEQGKRTDYLT